MILDFKVRGWRVIVGFNKEPTLRYGIHREAKFTAIGFWPLLIGIGRRKGWCRCL